MVAWQAAYSSAVNMGMLQESQLDVALTRVLTAHVRLGFFDSPAMVSYKRLPPELINSPPHRELARWVRWLLVQNTHDAIVC